MSKRVLLVLVCLLAVTVLGSCKGASTRKAPEPERDLAGASTSGGTATPSETPVRTATQTEPPPTATATPTWTSTATETPTPTDTPVPTNTATPTVAITATKTPFPTSTPLPDLSEAVLTLEDLPEGFEAIRPTEFGFTTESFQQVNLAVKSLFAFFNREQFTFVMGFTVLMPTPVQQAIFDIALQDPKLVVESVLQGLGQLDLSGLEGLDGLPPIGNTSTGLTGIVTANGLPLRLDIVVFRRDEGGAVALVLYADGTTPAVSVGEAAAKLDERVLDVLME